MGPHRGWCGSVHRTRKTAQKCIKKENDHCLKQSGHPTDRDIFDIHDPRVGLRKVTIYCLRPKEDFAAVEMTTEEKMKCIKILKEIFKGFMISQTDLVDGLEMDENDFEHYASHLMIYGVLRRVEKDGDIYWRCEKTHDAHKWDEVLDDFITLVGGIGTEEGVSSSRPRAKIKVSPSEKVSKYKNSTENPPSDDDLPVCSGCGTKLT